MDLIIRQQYEKITQLEEENEHLKEAIRLYIDVAGKRQMQDLQRLAKVLTKETPVDPDM